MSVILAMGTLFSFALWAAVHGKQKLEEQLPFAVTAMIVILYLFALLNQLLIGVYALLLLALSLFVAAVFKLLRCRSEKLWHFILTPGTLCFMLVCLWLLFAYRSFSAIVWDDFSHWQLVVKNMMIFDALPSSIAQATVEYRSYPPGTSLFAYFWTRMAGVFNEGDVQRANCMLMMCFLLPLMRNQDWKHWKSALGMFAVLFLLPLAFNDEVYYCAYVDILLGCLMLHALSVWFFCPRGKQAMLSIGAALVMLPLTKDSGFGLALIVLGIIAVDLFFCGGKKKDPSSFLTLAIFAACCVASKLSWSCYLTLQKVQEKWNYDRLTLSQLWNVLMGGGEGYQQEVLYHFIEAFVDPVRLELGYLIHPSLLGMMVGFGVIAQILIAQHQDPKCRKRYYTVAHGLIVGLLIYTFTLLLLYLFTFKDYEARSLVSFERYLSSYLFAIYGFLIALGDHCLTKRWQEKGISVSLAMLLCLFLLVNPAFAIRDTLHAAQRNEKNYQERMQWFVPSNVLERLCAQTDLVYVITNDDSGISFLHTAYDFAPVKTQSYEQGWWVVTELQPDYWQQKYHAKCWTADEWSRVLLEGGYTHVYLDKIQDDFGEMYGKLFAEAGKVEEDRLFKVIQQDSGVKLVAVY